LLSLLRLLPLLCKGRIDKCCGKAGCHAANKLAPRSAGVVFWFHICSPVKIAGTISDQFSLSRASAIPLMEVFPGWGG
jgi:hypothetical protein